MSVAPLVFVLIGLAVGLALRPRLRDDAPVTLYQPGDLVRMRSGL